MEVAASVKSVGRVELLMVLGIANGDDGVTVEKRDEVLLMVVLLIVVVF